VLPSPLFWPLPQTRKRGNNAAHKKREEYSAIYEGRSSPKNLMTTAQGKGPRIFFFLVPPICVTNSSSNNNSQSGATTSQPSKTIDGIFIDVAISCLAVAH
jgi:hypothetical protein